MKVKTYKTRSLHEGLEDIKRDLGSEALILSTRSVSVRPPFSLFKKPSWEITAALEEKVPELRSSPAAKPRVRVAGSTSAAAVAPAPIVIPEKPKVIIQKDHRMEELI